METKLYDEMAQFISVTIQDSATTASRRLKSISRRLDWLIPAWLEDVNAFDQSIDEDMLTVYYTIAVNLVICAFCILFFSVYRMRDPEIFTPKAKIAPEKVPKLIPNDTLFGWMRDLYNIDDDLVIDKAGYDVLFLIRFYRLSFKIFFFFAFYAWGVLLPINGYCFKPVSAFSDP